MVKWGLGFRSCARVPRTAWTGLQCLPVPVAGSYLRRWHMGNGRCGCILCGSTQWWPPLPDSWNKPDGERGKAGECPVVSSPLWLPSPPRWSLKVCWLEAQQWAQGLSQASDAGHHYGCDCQLAFAGCFLCAGQCGMCPCPLASSKQPSRWVTH